MSMYREPVKRFFFFLELPPHSLKRLSTRPTTVAVQSQSCCAVARDILGSLTPSSTPARRLAEGCSTAVLCVVTQCSSPQRLAVKQARRLAMCSHLCAVCVEFTRKKHVRARARRSLSHLISYPFGHI